jgi:hypothetical protein
MHMWKLNTKRLTKENYVKPPETYTERLSKEDIKEKLTDYQKVTDIATIPIGTHVRYFTTVNGKQLFRLGGFLFRNDGLPKYVILSNGTNTWSVQTKNTIFFRKLSVSEIKTELTNDIVAECKKKLDEKDKQITKLMKMLSGKNK